MRMLGRAAVLGLFSLGIGALVFAREGAERAPPKLSAPQKTSPAPSVSARPERGALGLIMPREEADVAALTAGQLLSVSVGIGDRVRAGDLLATLDSSLATASLAAAEAKLGSARARHEVGLAESRSATAREQRVASLHAQKLVSAEELENAVRDREVSRLKALALQASLEERAASVSRLKAKRALFEVRAPFDGTVVACYADAGAAVSERQTIVRLISSEDLFVRFSASKHILGGLELGVHVCLRIEGAQAAEALAVVERIAPEVDPATQLMIVEARILESKQQLIAGQIVRVFAERLCEK